MLANVVNGGGSCHCRGPDYVGPLLQDEKDIETTELEVRDIVFLLQRITILIDQYHERHLSHTHQQHSPEASSE